MASTILGFSRPDLRRVSVWLAALAVGTCAATLPQTPLQAGFIRAEAQLEAFRASSPNLAAVLSGKPAQADRLEPELFAIPVENKAALALGNAAQGMWSERSSTGSGYARILQSSTLAEGDLGLQWLLVLLQLQNGTRQGFLLQAQGLEASMLSQGWTRLPDASSWLLATAVDLQSTGDADRAELARSMAARLDPVSPIPEISEVGAALRSFHLARGYDHLENAWDRVMAFPLNQQVLAFNILRLFRYVLALSCLLLLLSWVVRYWPYIAHGLAERLPRDTNLYLRYAVLALIPVALLVAGLGLLSMCFLAALAIWRRARSYERLLIGAIVIFVGLQPWLAGLEATLSSRFDLAGPESLYQCAVDEGWSRDLDNRLQKAISRATSAERPLLLAANSIEDRKRGEYDSAMILARTAKGLGSDDPRILVNFGNAQFLVGHYDSATMAYESARQGRWGNGPPALRPGPIHRLPGSHGQHGAPDRQRVPGGALPDQPRGRPEHPRIPDPPPNRAVMDPELSGHRMWRHVLDDYRNRRWTVDRWDLQTGLLDLPPLPAPADFRTFPRLPDVVGFAAGEPQGVVRVPHLRSGDVPALPQGHPLRPVLPTALRHRRGGPAEPAPGKDRARGPESSAPAAARHGPGTARYRTPDGQAHLWNLPAGVPTGRLPGLQPEPPQFPHPVPRFRDVDRAGLHAGHPCGTLCAGSSSTGARTWPRRHNRPEGDLSWHRPSTDSFGTFPSPMCCSSSCSNARVVACR